MLMQGMNMLPQQALEHALPVWGQIEMYIKNSDYEKGLKQTLIWKKQALEIIEIIRNN